MRLWSLHPRYLDARGLVALWREALLAQAVLRERTRGYRHHPQLERFRALADPVAGIARYLSAVHDEALRRGYRFERRRIARRVPRPGLRPGPLAYRVPVTRGQLAWEWKHLRTKLSARCPGEALRLPRGTVPDAHPLFRVVKGPIALWERGARADGLKHE